MVKSLFPKVKLIENSENIGFSKGNNLATGLAKGEYLCILNPDTVIAEDTFQKILKFSDTKTNLGIVGCRFMDGSGKFLPECKRNIPKLFSALGKLLGNGRSYYATTVDQNSIAEVDILTGAFMLMRRELFTALNGFDEDFFETGKEYLPEKIHFGLVGKFEKRKNTAINQLFEVDHKKAETNNDKKFTKRTICG